MWCVCVYGGGQACFFLQHPHATPRTRRTHTHPSSHNTQSLLNDGSALVLFNVLQLFVQGFSPTPREVVLLFIRFAGLGTLIGIGFGFATFWWLGRCALLRAWGSRVPPSCLLRVLCRRRARGALAA